ncbi:MAG: GNAT family N-acetyltransferase [Ruegeria sp.]|uniref:GNAT family N-acetyltransferase n=1 Tax=Ruegeria sp. TaxID=1879320 RepID=UPI00349EAEAE
MSIIEIPAAEAHRLIPLLRQVHDLHVLHQPRRFSPFPADSEIAPWLADWLAQPDIHALGYETVGKLAGYAIYEIERRPASPLRPAETRAMLHHVSVDAEHRRQGIGTALIAAIRDRLDPDDIPVIATTYASFNLASAALMAASGFEPAVIFAEWRV